MGVITIILPLMCFGLFVSAVDLMKRPYIIAISDDDTVVSVAPLCTKRVMAREIQSIMIVSIIPFEGD